MRIKIKKEVSTPGILREYQGEIIYEQIFQKFREGIWKSPQ